MKGKLYKTEKENYVLVDPTKGTYDDGYMLGTSRESQYNKLSIKNCQAIECGYDLDELAMRYDLYENINFVGQMRAYKEGFQKALELMGDKKFSEYDMKEAYGVGFLQEGIKSFNSLIQSLQQNEWDVEVEMVPALSNNGNVYYGDIPKIDSDGCLILKRID